MQELLDMPHYSLMYFDLDHFKTYNTYMVLKTFITEPKYFLAHKVMYSNLVYKLSTAFYSPYLSPLKLVR